MATVVCSLSSRTLTTVPTQWPYLLGNGKIKTPGEAVEA